MPNTLQELIGYGSDNGKLENLAQLFLMTGAGQQPQVQRSPTVNIGGYNILDVTPRNSLEGLFPALQQLATGYLGMQQMNKQNQLRQQYQQFLGQVGQVVKSGKPPEEMIQDLMPLVAQNPQLAKMSGVGDIIGQHQKMLEMQGKEWKPKTKEEALGFEREKAGINKKDVTTSPILQKAKDTRAEKIIVDVEQNNIKRDMIVQAAQAAQGISGGIFGKVSRGTLRNLNPNNPILGEWQKIKMVLTDAQLMNTAKTKGAISDREMDLFAKAAANDDVASLPAMMPVFNKLLRMINADETGAVTAFKQLYNEDPYEWEGIKSNIKDIKLPQGSAPGSKAQPQTQNLQKLKSKYGLK